MKTKSSTKLMLGLAGSLLAIGSVQAQSSNGHLWGYTFGDYAYSMHGDSAGRGNGGVQYKGVGSASSTTANENAFDLRRVYLGYDYKINDKFSAHTLLAYEGNVDGNGNNAPFLKNAYLQWDNIFKGSHLMVGEMPTCSFATNTEGIWGYRSVEKTIMDMRKIDGSTDMGVGIGGNIWKADTGKKATAIGYNFMIGDNSGNNPIPSFTSGSGNSVTQKDKKWRFNVYLSALQDQLMVGIYADYINYGPSYYKTSTGYEQNRMTTKFYAAYTTKAFGIGVEYFQQTMANGELHETVSTGKIDTTSAAQSGLSIFAHATLIKDKLNIFARYDAYNPDTKYSYSTTDLYASSLVSADTYKETFMTFGLDWTPTTDKKVHIMPNLWYDGISNAYGSDKLKSDNYMVARVTFYYIFK